MAPHESHHQAAASDRASLSPPDHTSPRPAGAPRRRALLKALTICVVAIAALAAALPALLPKAWLRQRLETALAQRLRRPVHIARLQLGWRAGLLIQGIQVARRPDFGPGLLASIQQIRCPLRPWSWIGQFRAGSLQIDRPELWIVLARDGRLNLADLPDLHGSISAQTWSIRSAVLHLVDQQRNIQTDLHLGLLRCQLDERTGLARWQVHGRLIKRIETLRARPAALGQAARLVSDGRLTVPRLNRQVQLGGRGRFQWTRLDLSTLPVQWFPTTGIERLTGRSDGQLTLQVGPDLQLAWQLEARVERAAIWRQGHDRPQSIEHLQLRSAGRFDPNADLIQISDLVCQMPGLRIQRDSTNDSPAMLLSWRSRQPIRLNLAGQLDDLHRLRRRLPQIDRLLGPKTVLDGACRFRIRWVRSVEADQIAAQLSSRDLQLQHGRVVRCQRGRPVELQLELRYDRRQRRLHLQQLNCQLGSLTLLARAELPAPPIGSGLESWLQQVAGRSSLATELRIARLQELPALVPAIASSLGRATLAGPAQMRLCLQSHHRRTRLDWTARLPEESTCRLAGLIDKPPGRAAELKGLIELADPTKGRITTFDAQVTYGRGRAKLSLGPTPLRYAVRPATSPAPANVLLVDAAAQARLELQAVEELIPALPAVRRLLGAQQGRPALSGRCQATIGLTLSGLIEAGHAVPQLWRFRTRLQADALDVQLERPVAIRKPAGKPATLELQYLYDRQSKRLVHQAGLGWHLAGASGRVDLGWARQRQVAELAITATDLRQAAAYLPGLAETLGRYGLDGALQARVSSRRGDGQQLLAVELDASALAIKPAQDTSLRKPAGVPLTLTARLRRPAPTSDAQRQQILIDTLSMQLADCRLDVAAGRIVTSRRGGARLWRMHDVGDMRRWLPGGSLRKIELPVRAHLAFDKSLRQLSPVVRRWSRRYGLAGTAEAETLVEVTGGQVRLAGRLDATNLNVEVRPRLLKPAGMTMLVEMDATSRREGADVPAGRMLLMVQDCLVRLGANRFEGKGRLWVNHSGGWRRAGVERMELTARAEAPRLEQVGAVWPGLIGQRLRGAASARLQLQAGASGVRFGPSWLELRGVGVELEQAEVKLDGRVSWSQEELASEGLSVQVGGSSLMVAGQLRELGEHPAGQVMLVAERLDVDELRRLVEGRRGSGGSAARPVHLLELGKLLGLLRRCEVSGQGYARRLKLTDRKSGALLLIDELTSDFCLRDGRLELPLLCALNGGVVRGTLVSDLREDDPLIELQYRAENVWPDENVRPLIERFFPGMRVSGAMTLQERSQQRLLAAGEGGRYAVGMGKMTIEGGSVAGRAAPEWVTQIFPGLNLVRYDFRRMHNWFVKYADGQTHNRMIFLGRRYNIYMDGYSTADGRIEYEVGIDLLARWENPYWVERGQGRIPLFTKTGRIGPSGELLDERVRYQTAREVIRHILKDNLVTMAYHALMRRLRGS